MENNRADEPKKPIASTISLILLAILLTPIPGVDVIYDCIALFFIWKGWMNYFNAQSTLPEPNAAAQLIAEAAAYLDEGVRSKEAGEFAAAKHLFTLSAERGSANALNHLGLLHMEGLGTPKSYPLAAECFQNAILRGERTYAPANLKILREREQQETAQASPGCSMIRDEAHAWEVLELKKGASLEERRASRNRLLKLNHPDKGGSSYLAKLVNEAYDYLKDA